ncbi:MAG TPA: tripartite tricarboxylate transporter substrate-binding protein [Candidatus Binatia bacterium]|nr:tripartite tricarboxylate transporter substrate-binding protein [Candidatus Binatia bacterium]
MKIVSEAPLKSRRVSRLRGFMLLALLTVYGFHPLTFASVYAQEPFFRGKTVRIIVGFSPGGGFDTYARAISRHMHKHIPGNPSVIVENMTGAGSLIAANNVYKVAKPDGLTMGHFIGGLFVQQLLGRAGVEFDGRKFEYVGTPVPDKPVCALTKASGITSAEKWFAAKTPVKLGGTAPGSNTDDIPKILKAALGLPLQLVTGYKGTSDIRLAAEGGELAGGCWGWDSIRATWRKGIESGDAVVVLQTLPKPHPELPKIPLAINYAKTQEARQLIQAGIHDVSDVIRPYVLPPGTPKDRVQIMRKAFMDTMKDREFLADAEKSKLDIEPLSGEELEKTVLGLFKLSPSLIGKLKEALEAK